MRCRVQCSSMMLLAWVPNDGILRAGAPQRPGHHVDDEGAEDHHRQPEPRRAQRSVRVLEALTQRQARDDGDGTHHECHSHQEAVRSPFHNGDILGADGRRVRSAERWRSA